MSFWIYVNKRKMVRRQKLKHIKYDETKSGDKAAYACRKFLELVGPNGEILDGSNGRLISRPCHFKPVGSDYVSSQMVTTYSSWDKVLWAFDYSWTDEASSGGILYFRFKAKNIHQWSWNGMENYGDAPNNSCIYNGLQENRRSRYVG